MSNLFFAGDSESVSSGDDDDNLPYPQALPRSDFLAADFDALGYLSTLSERHQTLEDLRADLRDRSQALSKELLDLVNTNYEQFLSLGADLRGGEEKVEDVRVGLLGFKRGVEDVRAKVRERGHAVEGLLEEKTRVGQQISTGRKLLEFDARLEELEERLMVDSAAANGTSEALWSDDSEEDEADGDAEEDGRGGANTSKLMRLVQDYRGVKRASESVGSHHPFVMAQESRLMRVRNTLILDLSASLKVAYGTGVAASTRLLKVLSVYRLMEEGAEAIKVLKVLKG